MRGSLCEVAARVKPRFNQGNVGGRVRWRAGVRLTGREAEPGQPSCPDTLEEVWAVVATGENRRARAPHKSGPTPPRVRISLRRRPARNRLGALRPIAETYGRSCARDGDAFSFAFHPAKLRRGFDAGPSGSECMTSSELLRRLRRLGAETVPDREKGGHVMVVLRGRRAFVPTGSGDIKRGTLLASSGRSA
jgi:hypothetical protein